MFSKVIFLALLVFTAGCGILFPSAPTRFPQFSEHTIAGPGGYQIPQWSPDSRYLAYIDSSGYYPTLKVYDTETKVTWTVATRIDTRHFSWTPNGNLTYLRYRPDLSGSPYPMILDLYQVDLNGENDRIIAANLSSAKDFAWFSDGKRMVVLLTEPTSLTYFNDIYILDVMTGIPTLLLESEELDFQYVVSLALSPNEETLLVYGIQEKGGQFEAQIVIYDLETQTVITRLIPSQIIPAGNISYPIPGIGGDTNSEWVGGQRWFLASANTPGGDCYNYALFFFDTHDSQNSFCIPTVGGIISDPTISPDLTKISYITVVGVANYYLMIGTVTSDLLEQLDGIGE